MAKLTKAVLKKIIREELLKEGVYGEEDSFIHVWSRSL